MLLTTAVPVLCTGTAADDANVALGLVLVLVVSVKLTLSAEAPETLLGIGIGSRGVGAETDKGSRVSCDEVAALSTVNGWPQEDETDCWDERPMRERMVVRRMEALRILNDVGLKAQSERSLLL
jgi:hypothetical protein